MAKGITIDLIVDPKKALDGLDQVQDRSGKVSNVLGNLGSAAAVGVAALGTAAIGAVAGLTSATKSAGEYAENVQLAASKTHLSTDAVQELQYASKVTGVEFETITGSLTKLTRAMGTAQDGNKTTASAFAELGVATTDANGNLLDSTVVYSNVIAALGQVSNPAERDVLAMQLLGKSATELNPLIDGSAGSLADLAAQAQAAGSVLSGPMLEKLGSVDDAFDALSAGADAAKNALGLTLMPILQELGDQGTGLLGKFTNAVLAADGDLSKAAPAIGEVFGEAASFLLTQIPKFLEVGTSIISSILSGIAEKAGDLITSAVPVIANFAAELLGQLPMLIQTGFNIIVALLDGVTNSLPTLIPAVVTAVVDSITQLFDAGNLSALLDAGLALLTGLITGIISALPTLIAALPKIIVGIITFLVNAIPVLIEAGITLFMALIDALPQIIIGIVTAIPQIITGIITAVLGAIPKLIEAGIKLLIALVSATPTIIMEIIKAVPQIISGLVGAFTNPTTMMQIGNAGLQLIRGLWEGIKGAGDWLWKQMQGFFGGVIKNIKNLFGIRSPSTVFAGFGDFMIQGLEKGLTGPNNLGSIMTDLSDQVTGGFQGSLAATARTTVTTAASAVAPGASSDGFTADPQLHTLVRNLITAVSSIQPGWVLPEQLAQTNQVGTGRLAALGAS